ncbi:type IV secretory system conjugative DNA transfer family protein [Almyronema epifaneia]|uniref:Type IV secretory system conjugative DNA transfer family protein n=1 Tax=Almyronema epifaneia S1 TaxID=2991925 RepID=A0ABW6ICQ4_9CYAN
MSAPKAYIGVTPVPDGITSTGSNIFHSLQGQNGLVLVGAIAAMMVMSFVGKNQKKGQLARGYLAGSGEKRAARKKAMQQLQEHRHNAVTLYVGSAIRNAKGQINSGRSLWLPDAQRGIAVCGAPGSGKTFSMINPTIRSALDQGTPAIVYDFKYPDQTEVLAAYAAKRGYSVSIFAPGYPESEVCNPLDFLRDADDALMARQIATVMNRNFALSANASEDKFFADAGDQLTQAILMLAKGMPEPDLMMASAILSLTDLPSRIRHAKERGDAGADWQMSNWVYLAFSQLLQLAGSEKTVAGVIGMASKVFSRFLSQELVSAFCGQTTLPLDLEGKQLLILGLDRQRREAVTPLVATLLHLIVTRNVTRKRSDPLVLALDELPTLYLPYLTQWLNENRSDGLVTIVGFQNLTQLEKAYSREVSRSILGGCATKALFNPQDPDSARLFSDYLGEEEVEIKSKTKSTGKGGGSTSTAGHTQKRAIVEPAQFNKLTTGKCVLINPAYSRKDEGSIPLILKVKVPKADLAQEAWSKERWPKVRERLIAASHQSFNSEAHTREQLASRMAIAEQLFPLPKQSTPSAPNLKDPAILKQFQDVF